MSEKEKEKVTPEEYIKANTINDFYPDSEWVDPKHAIKAVELARKEGEERIREIIERLRQTLLNAPFASSQSYDYGLKTAIGIIQSYLPEKGDNNGVKTK